MNKNKIKKTLLASNILVYIAIIFGVAVMIKNYIDRSRLPEGVCPINNNQWLYYISIGLLVLAFIFNVIMTMISKKSKNEDEVDKQ